MSYGWIIDIDHIADQHFAEGTNANAKGVVGPEDISDWMEVALQGQGHWRKLINRHDAKIYRFRIYDDDGELYYTGRMITDEGATNEACGGPLWDFGQPNAGATEIRYVNHPEMNI